MKIYNMLYGAVLLLLSTTAIADQLSIQESSLTTATTTYYTNIDRRAQYNYDIKDKYVFMQYRRAGACPYYCGFNYNMYGLGIGINHRFTFVTMFVQAGYYIIDNSLGKTAYNENLYYYMNARFKSFDKPMHFKSYEVKNDNTFGITVGADIPFTNHTGVKFSYQYMKIKENIIGYLTEGAEFPALWWDPINRDYSTISAGFYYNF